MTYFIETYQIERAIVDAAEAYAERIMCDGKAKRARNYLTKEEAAEPVYAACDNAMRGRVEQFELLRDLPDKFAAYVTAERDDLGAPVAITVWTGGVLGHGKVNNVTAKGRRSGRCTIGGKQYNWQGEGRGMYCTLRAIKGR